MVIPEYSAKLRVWVAEGLASSDPTERRAWSEKLARETEDVDDADGLFLADLLADKILSEDDRQARSSELFALADLSDWDLVSDAVRVRIARIDPATLEPWEQDSLRRITNPDDAT